MLSSARSTLVPLHEDHFDALIQMYVECPEGNQFIPGLRDKTPQQYREVLLSKIDRNKEYVGFWTVFSKEDKGLVGTVNLYDYPGRGIIHIGLHLHTNWWGKGMAVELMERLLAYGFEEKQLDAIHAVIDERHTASRKLFEKLGFTISDSFQEGQDTILIYQKKNPTF